MEVLVTEKGGFCFGVKRAVNMAFEASCGDHGPVHTLGPLIHNPQVVERLDGKGVRAVSALEEIDRGMVILRSHGVSSPQVIEEAKARGLHVVDATCPFVTNAQRYAKQLVEEGYSVVMVGNRHHPEAQSILGHAGANILVTENFEEIRQMLNRFPKKRLGILSQTTQTFAKFSEIVSKALEICIEVKVFNTICYATEENQTETMAMADRTDAMVVVGGRNSANTTHLADICRERGIPTYHIEAVSEILPEMFVGVQRVGVTAGASTPDWIISEVVERLRQM